MATPLFAPIPVRYAGLYADQSLIDLQELGVSLQGLAKVSNAITHFYLHGQVAKDSRLYQIRLFAGPPRPGSITYEIVALIVTSSLPLYAPLLCELAESYVPRLFGAIVKLATGRRDRMEHVTDQLVEMANSHTEFAKQVHEGHMRDKAWLQNHIGQLVELNGAPLRELVRPVGRSCRQITLGSESATEPAVVDEAEAEVLSSQEKLEVGDMREYKGIFEGVDTTNGSCKVRIEGDTDVVRGKITDPALTNPLNVYTHSLDTKQSVIISAKPVIKDGEIVRLFISDGRFT